MHAKIHLSVCLDAFALAALDDVVSFSTLMLLVGSFDL